MEGEVLSGSLTPLPFAEGTLLVQEIKADSGWSQSYGHVLNTSKIDIRFVEKIALEAYGY